MVVAGVHLAAEDGREGGNHVLGAGPLGQLLGREAAAVGGVGECPVGAVRPVVPEIELGKGKGDSDSRATPIWDTTSARVAPAATGTAREKKTASGRTATLGGGGPLRKNRADEAHMVRSWGQRRSESAESHHLPAFPEP